MQVSVADDCGNAPKRAFLRDFVTALAEHNNESLLTSVTNDVQWELVGNTRIYGKDLFAKQVEKTQGTSIRKLTIHNILTHGDSGAIDGTLEYENDTTYGFCTICKFSSHAKNAKIKIVTSYIIKLASKS